MKTKQMDLNRETAMRLWNKCYGKETKVKDFTGREIAKGAYNDRNSEFGWNLDHILPQSKGGKTADYNLVCCHILTNDEKADRFPGFKANGITFEIVKVENHYEIQRVSPTKTQKKAEDGAKVNFMDSASGVRLFKKLKGIQNKSRFVGTVFIRLQNMENTAVMDWIEKLFDSENVSYSMQKSFCQSESQVTVKNYNMPHKEDIEALLEKGVVLNTYLQKYFLPSGYISGYDIFYRVDYYNQKTEMYFDAQKIQLTNAYVPSLLLGSNMSNGLYINSLVICNTDAAEEVSPDRWNEFTEYNYTYTNLAKNLKKEVNG